MHKFSIDTSFKKLEYWLNIAQNNVTLPSISLTWAKQVAENRQGVYLMIVAG